MTPTSRARAVAKNRLVMMRLLRRRAAGRADPRARVVDGGHDGSSALSVAEPFPGARVTRISVGGRATRVLDAGDGPALACSPGIASLVWDWVPLARRLASTHRVIVVARPLVERADVTAGVAPTLQDDAARLLGALDALGVTGPVTLVGHSFGGVVAEAATRSTPERAAALVLLDGSLAEDGPDPTEPRRSARRTRLSMTALRSRPIVAAWSACGPTILTLAAPARRSLVRSIPGLPDEMASIDVLAACLGELSSYPAYVRQLHALRTSSPLPSALPTLVIAANGRLPRRSPTRWVRAVLRQAKGLAEEADLRTAVIERSGHFIMLDRPQRVADLIIAFGSR